MTYASPSLCITISFQILIFLVTPSTHCLQILFSFLHYSPSDYHFWHSSEHVYSLYISGTVSIYTLLPVDLKFISSISIFFYSFIFLFQLKVFYNKFVFFISSFLLLFYYYYWEWKDAYTCLSISGCHYIWIYVSLSACLSACLALSCSFSVYLPASVYIFSPEGISIDKAICHIEGDGW